MCRILALTQQLPKLSLATTLIQFGSLAESGLVMEGSEAGHRDGWGMVCYRDGRVVQKAKRATDASKDSSYGQVVEKISAEVPELSMVHLRKQSIGAVAEENTHPFLLDNWSLCHNGTLFGSESIPLSEEMKACVRGTSDTERLFLSIMGNLRKISGDPKNIRAGIIDTVAYIRQHHDYVALNILLSDGKKLWALREVNERNALVKGSCSFEYLSLYVAMNSQGKVMAVCSEKLDVPESMWRPMPNHTLLEIDIRTHTQRGHII
ncbi:MAG: class II glutamine amidotransferase [Candidatus Moranbacteria bacterium]|nr:class II glutamine amidotransferase [Candidatus Moranbacteria bacterium]